MNSLASRRSLVPTLVRLWAAALTLAAFPTFGQPAPEVVGRGPTLSLRGQLEEQMESSTFRLWRAQLEPIFEIQNLGYDSNIFVSPDEEVSDFTASFAAGARGLLPLGRKHFVRGDATADYFWFAKEEGRRNWGWNGGGSLLGVYNRATLQASARSSSRLEPVSEEVDALFERRTTTAAVGAEVLVLPKVSLFGRVEANKFRHPGDVAESITRLDRTDTIALIGLSYSLGTRSTVGLMTSQYRSDFVSTPDRDGFIHLLMYRFEGNRLFVNASGGRRNLNVDEPLAQGFDDATGSYFASLRSLRGSAVELYGSRALQYSVDESSLYYLAIRNAVAGSLVAGSRMRFRAAVELGKNEYPGSGGSPEQRTDDVITLEGGFWFRVFRNSVLSFNVSQSDYDSTVPEFDRSVLRITSTFALRGDFF